jgi:hypothetical protein
MITILGDGSAHVKSIKPGCDNSEIDLIAADPAHDSWCVYTPLPLEY